VSTEHPDLGGLLRGELGNADALAAARHARSCEWCRAELVELAAGHGLLTAARATLGAGTPEPQPAHAPREPLPDQLREAVGQPRRRLRRSLAAAAVLAVLAGAAGIGYSRGAFGTHERDRPAPAAEQAATLEAVPGSGLPRATGRVSMASERGHVTRMHLAAGHLPTAPKGEFYYAWLLDPRTDKMLPLGQVDPRHVATFDVPEPLVASYSAVDVSLEADDGNPGHSVTSVLRATYADPAKAHS